MDTIIILACEAICIIASLALTAKTVRRAMKERDSLSYSLLALSILWSYIIVAGVLRLNGVLPPVADRLTMQEITNFMGSVFAPVVVIGFTVCYLVLDAMLWLLVSRISNSNKTWWIIGSLVAFLVGMLALAVMLHSTLHGQYSVDTLFFVGCCASMALPGWAVGLTYKEICVIVNIYLEAGLCVLSAVWLMKVLWQRATVNPVLNNKLLAGASVAYTALYVIAFIGIVAYYPPPLDDAFDKCYRDLIRWAGEYGSTYNNVNYVIFIASFLVPVSLNCLLAHVLKTKNTQQI